MKAISGLLLLTMCGEVIVKLDDMQPVPVQSDGGAGKRLGPV